MERKLRKLLFLSAIIFLLSIFLAPRVPFQDYADWIYQANVYKGLLVSDPVMTNNFSLNPHVVPNSAATVIMGLLNFVMSADYAGKTFVIITFILLVFGLKSLFVKGCRSDILAISLALIFAASIFFFSIIP